MAASTNLLTVVLNTMFRYWLAGMVILSCARVALEEHGDCSKELRQSDSHLSSTHPLNINRNQPFNLKTRHETITRYSHNLALLSSPPVHTTPLLEWNATETTPALCPARVPTQVPEHRSGDSRHNLALQGSIANQMAFGFEFAAHTPPNFLRDD